MALTCPPPPPGDIISRLSADTTQVSDLISQNVNIFLRSCIKAVGHFVFMWGISWRLTLVAVMGFPFVGLVSQLYGDYYKVGQGREVRGRLSYLPEEKFVQMFLHFLGIFFIKIHYQSKVWTHTSDLMVCLSLS